jgi:fructose-bisphosphate aldolase class II
MSYVNLTEIMTDATKGKYAVGAFNFFNYLTARMIIETCEEQKSPVILQTSVKTVKQLGAQHIFDMVMPLVKKAQVPVVLHLDHCKDIEFAKYCIDIGWSSIMYDGSSFSFEENIKNTKSIVNYAKGKGVSVEGELGAIVGVEDDIVVDSDEGHLADVDLSVRFTEETEVDAFAPAIGTAHGLYKGEPNLDFQRFADIRSKVKTNLVLHGGTGLTDDVFRKLITIGAAKINISTAIKMAYFAGMKASVGLTEPLQADKLMEKEIQTVVRQCIEIFGSVGKA